MRKPLTVAELVAGLVLVAPALAADETLLLSCEVSGAAGPASYLIRIDPPRLIWSGPSVSLVTESGDQPLPVLVFNERRIKASLMGTIDDPLFKHEGTAEIDIDRMSGAVTLSFSAPKHMMPQGVTWSAVVPPSAVGICTKARRAF